MVLDITTLDRHMFADALTRARYDPSYRDSMQKRSRLHRDQPMKPLDLAVFCIEYLMRHKGAQHLRTHVNEMSWFVIKAIKIKLN